MRPREFVDGTHTRRRTSLPAEPGGNMYQHLLVTLDGTSQAECVIPHAVSLARALRARITFLKVVDAIDAGWSERGAVGKSVPYARTQTPYTERAQAYVDRIAAGVRDAGVDAGAIVRQGQPARKIIETARELGADAVAMATHSRRGLNRLVFGSVAEQVLHGATVPVLLVKSA